MAPKREAEELDATVKRIKMEEDIEEEEAFYDPNPVDGQFTSDEDYSGEDGSEEDDSEEDYSDEDDASSSAQPKGATLFDLPAELRNRIYEYVLLERVGIRITSSSKEPSLLQTCRQIRSEGIKMWYFRNGFWINVYSCAAGLLGMFTRRVAKYEKAARKDVQLMIFVEGRPNWGHLMRWCQEVHAGISQVPIIEREEKSDLEVAVLAALEIAYVGFKTPWAEVESTLKAQRSIYGRFDRKWLN